MLDTFLRLGHSVMDIFVYTLWRNVISNPLPNFLIGLFAFLLLRGKGSLYILDTAPLSDI